MKNFVCKAWRDKEFLKQQEIKEQLLNNQRMADEIRSQSFDEDELIDIRDNLEDDFECEKIESFLAPGAQKIIMMMLEETIGNVTPDQIVDNVTTKIIDGKNEKISEKFIGIPPSDSSPVDTSPVDDQPAQPETKPIVFNDFKKIKIQDMVNSNLPLFTSFVELARRVLNVKNEDTMETIQLKIIPGSNRQKRWKHFLKFSKYLQFQNHWHQENDYNIFIVKDFSLTRRLTLDYPNVFHPTTKIWNKQPKFEDIDKLKYHKDRINIIPDASYIQEKMAKSRFLALDLDGHVMLNDFQRNFFDNVKRIKFSPYFELDVIKYFRRVHSTIDFNENPNDNSEKTFNQLVDDENRYFGPPRSDSYPFIEIRSRI